MPCFVHDMPCCSIRCPVAASMHGASQCVPVCWVPQVSDHPNVVDLHEVWEDASYIFIVMVGAPFVLAWLLFGRAMMLTCLGTPAGLASGRMC